MAAWMWVTTLGLTAIRLWMAAWVPLGDDEGYYWVWSRHLSWSYYDHPPVVAWLVLPSTHLLGNSLLALRLPFVACGTLSALVLRALVAETTGDTELARRASMMFQITPILFALGLLVIPDAPLLLCWLLAGRAAWRFRQRSDHASAVLLGLALGGACLSKYIAALLLLSLFAFLLLSRGPKRAGALITVFAIVLLMQTPVLWWNAIHHWVSFRYQFAARHEGAHFDLGRALLYLGSQALYLSPPLFVLVCAAVLRVGPWKWERSACGARLLWWLGAPTAWVFLGVAGLTHFKPNWPAPAYATLVALAICGLQLWRQSRSRLAGAVSIATAVAAIACTALPAVHLTYPVLSLPRHTDPTLDMTGWSEIAQRAERAAAKLRAAGRPTFFAAGRYQLASRLEFSLPGHPEVVSLDPGRDAYDDWQDLEQLKGSNAVFIVSDRYPTPPDRLIRCDSVRVDSRVVVRRYPQPFSVTIYDVWGFRPGG